METCCFPGKNAQFSITRDAHVVCACGCVWMEMTWQAQSVTLQSDSPVGMTKHGFNARSTPTR